MNDKQYKFKGIIEKCIYNAPDFKIYAVTIDKVKYPELKQNKYNNISIIGELPELIINTEYEIIAEEQINKYGTSYKVINIRRDIPTTTKESYLFLCSILTENQDI